MQRICTCFTISTLVLTSCRFVSGDSAADDVITDIGTPEESSIFYGREGRIYRGQCPSGESNPSRERCNLNLAHVDLAEFSKRIGSGTDDGLSDRQDEALSLYARLSTIDDQLASLITNFSDGHENIIQQVSETEAELGDVIAKIGETRGELFEIERALALSEQDDLRQQVLQLKGQLRSLEEKRNETEAQLTRLRQQLVELRASVSDPALFDGFAVRRVELNAAYEEARTKVQEILDRLISLNRLETLILNPNFTVEIVESSASFADLKPHAAKMNDIFATLLQEQSMNGPELTVIDGEAALPETRVRFEIEEGLPGRRIAIKVDGTPYREVRYTRTFSVSLGADSRSCGDHKVQVQVFDEEGYRSGWSEQRTFSIHCWTDTPELGETSYSVGKIGEDQSIAIPTQSSAPAWAVGMMVQEVGGETTRRVDLSGDDLVERPTSSGLKRFTVVFFDEHGWRGRPEEFRMYTYPSPDVSYPSALPGHAPVRVGEAVLSSTCRINVGPRRDIEDSNYGEYDVSVQSSFNIVDTGILPRNFFLRETADFSIYGCSHDFSPFRRSQTCTRYHRDGPPRAYLPTKFRVQIKHGLLHAFENSCFSTRTHRIPLYEWRPTGPL